MCRLPGDIFSIFNRCRIGSGFGIIRQMTELDGIIEDIKEYLTLQHECGKRYLCLPNDCIPVVKIVASARPATSRPAYSVAPQGGAPRPAIPAVKEAPMEAEPAVPASGADSLAQVAAEIASCDKCELCRHRTNVVPGQGNANHPNIMFIGEAPGQDEDLQGLAFVGRAGQLLTKMIAAMGYTREEVFIANVCKCRPPGNRNPDPAESAACLPFLERQIAIVRPKCIVALGRIAMQALYNAPISLSSVRGKWMDYHGTPILPTFHPAYLLRYPVAKRDAWADLKKVMAKYPKQG